MAKKKTSGLEKIPNIISRPIWKDNFFWLGIATALFWIFLIYFLFF